MGSIPERLLSEVQLNEKQEESPANKRQVVVEVNLHLFRSLKSFLPGQDIVGSHSNPRCRSKASNEDVNPVFRPTSMTLLFPWKTMFNTGLVFFYQKRIT